MELRTTFSNGTSSRMINIRPALNKLGAVALTRHMKMKFPSFEGGVIVIKSDQETAKKCYKNSLKNKRGICVIAEQI